MWIQKTVSVMDEHMHEAMECKLPVYSVLSKPQA